MMPKVLILTDNNPLSQSHYALLVDQKIEVELKELAQCGDCFHLFNVIISMECHFEADPFNLSALETVFLDKYKKLPEVKFIFLSHFNFSDHFRYYAQYITPLQNELLDEEKCRFLSLPVTNKETLNTVQELLKKVKL